MKFIFMLFVIFNDGLWKGQGVLLSADRKPVASVVLEACAALRLLLFPVSHRDK